MQRLIKITSFLLLALWLPATLHCEMEAANIHFLTHDEHHHDHDAGAEIDHSIEDAAYTGNAPTLKVLPPAGSPILFLSVMRWISDDCATSVLAPTSHPPPPDISVAWQFLTRAAPPARAPSLNT